MCAFLCRFICRTVLYCDVWKRWNHQRLPNWQAMDLFFLFSWNRIFEINWRPFTCVNLRHSERQSLRKTGPDCHERCDGYMSVMYQWGCFHWRMHCPRSRRCTKKSCPYHCALRRYSYRADSTQAIGQMMISTVTAGGCCSTGCSVNCRPASD